VIGTVLTSVTNFMLRPYLVLYLNQRLEGSVLLPMLIVGLQPLCGMLVNLYGGAISDRYGRKPVMLASLWIQAVCMLGYIFAESVWQYALVAILIGFGNALFLPAANAQIADVVPERQRAQVYALLHTAFNIGAAAGPLIGLAMFSWHPQYVFLISALTTIIYSLLLWAKVPETRPERALSRHPAAPSERTKGRLLEHKALLLMTLFGLPVGLLYAQVDTTLPLHLQKHFDNYKSVLATLLTFNGLVVIALQMWIAKRSEAMSAYLMVGASYGLFAIVALGYGFVPFFGLLLAVEFVFTIGEMLYGPHIQKVISKIAPEHQRGWYFSVFGMNQQLSRAVGPIFGGLLLSRFSGEFLFIVLALLLVVFGFCQVRIIRQTTFVHIKATSVHSSQKKDSVTVRV
jgi:MFS family permease